MRDVSKRKLETQVLGQNIAFPVGIAPTAMQRMAHPDGEAATVKGRFREAGHSNSTFYTWSHDKKFMLN